MRCISLFVSISISQQPLHFYHQRRLFFCIITQVSGVITILSTVIRQEYEFLGALRGELQSIRDEFQHMMAFLEGADVLVQDHPDLRTCWVAQVRDVAYDVEDVLDEFVMRCTYRRSTRWYGVFKKMYNKSVGAIKARHVLATRVQEIKKRIRDISESHGRYKTQHQSLLPEQGSSLRVPYVNGMVYGKSSDALFLEEAELVGIEVPKKELTDLLLNKDDRRNVISVVGMGGLGKTALVKNVYDDDSVKSQFVHHVWITVSQSFKLEELFKDIIRQLFNEEGRQLQQELDGMDINRLKLVVKDLLQTKKYLVVFDDVWQITHWDAIQIAYPRNQFGSRIVITTRNNDVGNAASMSEVGGSVYVLSPLDNGKPMVLFCRKAFPDGIHCPPHLLQICEKILGACGGLPLAIEVIGRNLARRSRRAEAWESFYKRLGVEMERNSQLDAMTKLLSLSYHDLPLHLKNCFLYLSIFPEDSEINKMVLARLWIGEGFVETINGMTPEEVAESYLVELLDRCLVQVAGTYDWGEIRFIRVHDIIRNIILLKAREHNITTILDGQEGMSIQNKVMRISVQASISGISEEAQDYCKSIRTLYLSKHVGGNISESFLSDLLSNSRKLLKVLSLEGHELNKFPDEICKLFHLKYLDLRHTNVRSIPKSIGMLQNLQFLILLGTHVTELPVEIQKLQHLRHLTICGSYTSNVDGDRDIQGARVSFRIGSLKSLQELYFIEADQVDNIRVVTELGKLVHLRELGITKLKREDVKELCSSLGNLRELRELWVSSASKEEFIDFQYLKSTDLPCLQRLFLVGCLEKCPKIISSLIGLKELTLEYSRLRDDPLKCLHDLPNLISLTLKVAYQGKSLCFKPGEFPKLKILKLVLLEEVRWLTMEENALPSLQVLKMISCESMEEIPTGIEYLMHLQNIEFFNMSNEFVNKLIILDKQSATYKRFLQIPRVAIGTWSEDGRSETRVLSGETGTFD